MDESKNFRVALLSGASAECSNAVTPILLELTDFMVVVETVEELFSAQPEIIFVCHQPGSHDVMASAALIRARFALVPLVIMGPDDVETLKAALKVGAVALIEPPFTESAVVSAFHSCCHPAQALRWEALKQQQSRNTSGLFMKLPFCHLFVDTDGMVTYHNDEASKIMGLAPGTVSDFNKIFGRFFSPHALTYPHELETAMQSRATWNGVLSGRLPDDAVRIYRVICLPHTLADGASGVVITLHDVTKMHMDQARFFIERQAARDCLALADRSEINDDLRQLSQRECCAPQAQEAFSLSSLIESTAGGAVKAPIALPGFMPKHFCGDIIRLRYALKAAISGSAVFGDGAPQISLSLKERTPAKMTVQINIHANNISVTSDSYLGIDDYLTTVGTMPDAADGLGLAAVLIEKMNGTTLVRSESGYGRTVIISVPLSPAEDDKLSEIPSTGLTLVHGTDSKEIPPLKILVAEDNLMEQTTLKHLLESIGCLVVVVSNGREAVDEFENGEFDIVLMDILMPVMDGFDATRLIREKERIIGGRIPVVALTSYSLKAIQDKCVSVGMNGYLAKPVVQHKLVEALQRLTKSHELPAQAAQLLSEINELPILEVKSVLDNLDNNLEVYRELVEMCLINYAELGNELAEKLAGNDLKEILSTAHSLKGVASNIGGRRLTEATRQIQNMCIEGIKPDKTVWTPVVRQLDFEFKAALGNIDWNKVTRLVAEKN